jgi:hypothetical protein
MPLCPYAPIVLGAYLMCGFAFLCLQFIVERNN